MPHISSDALMTGHIAPVLHAAILHTLKSYADFSFESTQDGTKEFGAHHTACKAALAHLESLLKLHNLCRPVTAQDIPDSTFDIDTLLQQARKVLSKNES